jgi:hypothetical protein
MDRFKVEIKESQDKVALRLTEVETTVQDQRMDVETAVQLERLEEVERAVLMLDPDILRSEPAMDRVPPRDQQSEATYESAPTPSAAVPEPPPAPVTPEKRSAPIAPVEFSMGGVPPISAPATSPLAPPTADPTGAHSDATVAMNRPTVNN